MADAGGSPGGAQSDQSGMPSSGGGAAGSDTLNEEIRAAQEALEQAGIALQTAGEALETAQALAATAHLVALGDQSRVDDLGIFRAAKRTVHGVLRYPKSLKGNIFFTCRGIASIAPPGGG